LASNDSPTILCTCMNEWHDDEEEEEEEENPI
jgi:hypothetical protein